MTDKSAILNCLNEHFVSSGSLFDSLHSDPKQLNEKNTPPFNFSPLDAIEGCV